MTAPPEDVLDLLTAYVLDALEPQEVARVSQLLNDQPELYETLAELRATVHQLPFALPDGEPSPDLRQRTLDYALGRTSRSSSPSALSAFVRLRRWTYGLAGALAITLVALLVVGMQYARTANELGRVQQQLVTIQANQQRVALMISQSNALVKLTGDNGRGAILRTADGATVLAANLPPLQSGRTYQLWTIQGQNAPISAGVFSVQLDGSGLVVLQQEQQLAADTFAVTNEPAGGSPGPTTPIVIAGKVPIA